MRHLRVRVLSGTRLAESETGSSQVCVAVRLAYNGTNNNTSDSAMSSGKGSGGQGLSLISSGDAINAAAARCSGRRQRADTRSSADRFDDGFAALRRDVRQGGHQFLATHAYSLRGCEWSPGWERDSGGQFEIEFERTSSERAGHRQGSTLFAVFDLFVLRRSGMLKGRSKEEAVLRCAIDDTFTIRGSHGTHILTTRGAAPGSVEHVGSAVVPVAVGNLLIQEPIIWEVPVIGLNPELTPETNAALAARPSQRLSSLFGFFGKLRVELCALDFGFGVPEFMRLSGSPVDDLEQDRLPPLFEPFDNESASDAAARMDRQPRLSSAALEKCCGYLVKKGAKRRNWLRRWCVLSTKDGVLSYYASSISPPDEFKGRIKICDADCGNIMSAESKKHGFYVRAADGMKTTFTGRRVHIRTFQLSCPTRAEFVRWKTALLRAGAQWGRSFQAQGATHADVSRLDTDNAVLSHVPLVREVLPRAEFLIDGFLNDSSDSSDAGAPADHRHYSDDKLAVDLARQCQKEAEFAQIVLRHAYVENVTLFSLFPRDWWYLLPSEAQEFHASEMARLRLANDAVETYCTALARRHERWPELKEMTVVSAEICGDGELSLRRHAKLVFQHQLTGLIEVEFWRGGQDKFLMGKVVQHSFDNIPRG